MTGCIPALMLGLSFAVASAALGADFDGKLALVCAPGEVSQCDTSASCEKVAAGEIELPDQFQVDFQKKLLHSTDGKRSSPISHVDASESTLIFQGAQNGRGWSIAIDRATGYMTGTIADIEGAFVLTATCSKAP